MIIRNGNTFKALNGLGAQFDYAVFVSGEDDAAATICSMAAVALNGAKTYYEEKHDKATFVKNIISDNILLGDIYMRAKELHFVSEVPRAVFLVRQVGSADVAAIDVVQGLFPDQPDRTLSSPSARPTSPSSSSSPKAPTARTLYKIAKSIEEAAPSRAEREGGHRHRHHRQPPP